MRITGGKYRNLQIKCPEGVIRPAMDRMRESMFSILGSLNDSNFLDLFAGSGIIGLEAASRGADKIRLVEKDFIKKKVIEENISKVKEDIKLFLMPVEKYIKMCIEQYDIIHTDPPFPYQHKLKVLEMIAEQGILKENGTLMMHYPGEESYPDQIGNLRKYDHRKYGRSQLIFYTTS